MKEVEIIVARSAGVCFGVERALHLSEKALRETTGKISSLGPLIHNPQTVEDLQNRGLKVAQNLEGVSGTIVFRSHGVTTQVSQEAAAKGLKIVDATCPLVKVPQNFARKLSQNGYFVIIVGDKDHPEIQGVKSYVENGQVTVLKNAAEVADLSDHEKVGVICQTTLKKSLFFDVVEECQKRFKEVKVHNTICSATRDRQEAAEVLASQVDCVIVIGGRGSSNTQKLYDISLSLAPQAHLIETEAELDLSWFDNVKRVGLTAGASTPHALIDRVGRRIREITILSSSSV